MNVENTEIKKRKIHILTFWGVPNYGAWAQAYALQKVIQGMYPDDEVQQIAYLHHKHKDSYFKRQIPMPGNKKDLIDPRYYKRIIKNTVLKRVDFPIFEKAWNEIPHIDVESVKDLEDYDWDIIITGSDAIWQYSLDAFGNDEHLLGLKMKHNKLVSYAASFGNTDMDDGIPEFVEHGLKGYDKVSVRDVNSRLIVEKLTGLKSKDVPISVDPTLLYDFTKEKNIPKYRGSDYIVVYGSGFPKNVVHEVKKYARSNKKVLIGIGHDKAPRWCDRRIMEIEPFKWMSMIKGSDFIVTNTFHGMLFSIIFNKKFYFYQSEYVKNRSMAILRKIGLDKLFLSKDFSIEMMHGFDWDYDRINDVISCMRKESMSFLKMALDKD